MDKKGVCDLVYPEIMFCVDDFEEAFASLQVARPGEKVAIQLMAVNYVLGGEGGKWKGGAIGP